MAAVPRTRPWSGPAILSYGFRPFFLLAGIQAVWTLLVWTAFQLDLSELPAAWPPAAWHAHELLFGYASAALAGFLLTAVPNWTGRLPLSGLPLAGLAGLWLLGRFAVAASGGLPAPAVAAATLLFPAALLLLTAREVLVGANRRNYPVIGLVGVLLLAQLAFHLELSRASPAPLAAHAAIALYLLLILLIGGRIVPSFTTNWLRHARPGVPLPAPFDRFDQATLGLAGFALALLLVDRVVPLPPAVPGLAALAAGLAHIIRLARWRPLATLAEPLLWVLHLAYLFVPLGFLAAGGGLLLESPGLLLASTHLWTVGGIGLMTLAVMTRATRGHTGRALHAPPATAAAYLALTAAALSRAGAAVLPEAGSVLVPVAGFLWLAAFSIFLRGYAPMLLSPRVPAGSPA